ncbi:hypothetical protein ACFSTE_06040 [Aquimarina hainanensis]|uniref:AMOP domain-containing protein n=1 Tax=Aquimarina hainanensis TaxID=1578017 RepID=A0ABW5N771_9FLAO
MIKKTYLVLSILLLAIFACQKDDASTNCIDLEFLKGEWIGEFHQYNYGKYPMIMIVKNVDGCHFSGELYWPTLRNSVTVMEGHFKNNMLFWTEPHLISGSNIVLNGEYTVPFSNEKELSGNWYYPNQPSSEGGVFTISQKWYEYLPDCPCFYFDASSLGKTLNPPGQWQDCGAANQDYHYGATTEVRWIPDGKKFPGQQCTYDSSGKLITSGIAAGTPDKVSPRICGFEDASLGNTDPITHFTKDVITWKILPCAEYLRDWPANADRCSNDNPISDINHIPKLAKNMSCEELSVLIQNAYESTYIDWDLRDYITGKKPLNYPQKEKLLTDLNEWYSKECNSIGLPPFPLFRPDLCYVINKTIENIKD